jgi:RNA recognition motif-containing protein
MSVSECFDSSGKLFVGSIASTTTREDLLRLFAPFGSVAEVVVLAERDGRPKFSAFVNMRRRVDAQRAIDTLDRALTLPNAKKIIEVRFASSRPRLNEDVASTAPSSPKTPSRLTPSSFDGSLFKVQVLEEVVQCSSAFEAVVLWLELLELHAMLLPIV